MALYKTTNSGGVWSPLTGAPDYTGSAYAYGGGSGDQGWYDNVVAVDPTNANHVVAGGIAVVETTDGGTTWGNVNGQPFFGGGANLLHPDQHAIAFRPDHKIWLGDDGGVFLYDPPGPTVTNSNGNLDITQFYFGFNEVGGTLLAGSQDNGSARTSSSSESAWTGIFSGDGGPSAITPNHSATQFIEADQNLYRTTDGFVSSLSNITPPQLGLFTPPMTVIANSADPANPTVFYGGPDLYRTTNPSAASPTWTKVTTDGSKVSALAVSPSNPQVVYVGFTDGVIQVSTNGGVSFNSLASQPFSQTYVTGISVDPANPQAITASVSFNDTRYGSGLPHVAQYVVLGRARLRNMDGHHGEPAEQRGESGHLRRRRAHRGNGRRRLRQRGPSRAARRRGRSSGVGSRTHRCRICTSIPRPPTSTRSRMVGAPWRLPVAVCKPPAGYALVNGPVVRRRRVCRRTARVTCPTGTKPVGGGVATDSADLAVNVNSSYPTAKGWAGNLNNGSADATNLIVWAVCVKRPTSQFTVTSTTFSSTPHSQEVGEVACPAGVVVGGGVSSTSKSLLVNITSTDAPSTTAWDGWINNVSKKTSSFTTYAICRNKKPAGYSIQSSAFVDNPSGADTYSSVTCPGASLPLSGGVYSTGTGLGENLNTYTPFNNTWYSYFNNADAVDKLG